MHHFGDPCVHCAIPHDDVPPGPCNGDPSKAVPIAYRSLGVRWDGVEHFLIRLSNDCVIERHNHISEQAPYWHFGWSDTFKNPPRHEARLTPKDITP